MMRETKSQSNAIEKTITARVVAINKIDISGERML